MRKQFATNRQIDFVFPVMIFFAFTLSALIVILFAAQVYQHTIEDAAMNYNANTSLAYIREKIHQHDNGRVSVGSFDGCDSIIMKEKLAGELYDTYIYASDGTLRELFIKDGTINNFSPESGQAILEVQEFSVSKEKDDLLSFVCVDKDGHTASARVGIYSAEVAK